MYKKLLIISFFIMHYTHAQTEKFIDPKDYIQQTTITNEETKTEETEIIDFIQNTEERNTQKREERSAKKEKKEAEFMLPTQSYEFEKIDAIVLDAGHGGKDPGGIGHGIEEKRLVLTMVKKIHALFRKHNRKINIKLVHSQTGGPVRQRC